MVEIIDVHNKLLYDLCSVNKESSNKPRNELLVPPGAFSECFLGSENSRETLLEKCIDIFTSQ